MATVSVHVVPRYQAVEWTGSNLQEVTDFVAWASSEAMLDQAGNLRILQQAGEGRWYVYTVTTGQYVVMRYDTPKSFEIRPANEVEIIT